VRFSDRGRQRPSEGAVRGRGTLSRPAQRMYRDDESSAALRMRTLDPPTVPGCWSLLESIPPTHLPERRPRLCRPRLHVRPAADMRRASTRRAQNRGCRPEGRTHASAVTLPWSPQGGARGWRSGARWALLRVGVGLEECRAARSAGTGGPARDRVSPHGALEAVERSVLGLLESAAADSARGGDRSPTGREMS